MSEGRSRIGRWALKLLDGLQYAVAVNVILVVVLAPLTSLATGSLVALKWLLFLVGLPLMAYGSLKLRPPIRTRGSSRFQVADSRATDGFGARVGSLPPVSLLEPAPKEFLSDGARITMAGVGAWVVSYLMEAVLGVGVPTVG